MHQMMGVPDQGVRSTPADDMRSTEGLTPREVEELMLGTDAVLLLEEGDNATYRYTYLMPPLSDVRVPRRRAANVPSSSRA